MSRFRILAGCIAISCLFQLVGCAKPAPQLKYVKIGIAEDNEPLVLGVVVENTGEVEVKVDGCEINLASTHIFQAQGETRQLPAKFEHYLEIPAVPKDKIIQAHEIGIIPVAFRWDLSDDPPEMIAVCRASFALRYNSSHKVETEEVMLVLASSLEAREKILSESFANVKEATEFTNTFEQFQGNKSDDTMKVIELLQEAAKQ